MNGEGWHAARVLLLTGGGMLVSRGWIDAATNEALVGATLVLGGAGWSWFERQRLRSKAGEPVGGLARVLIRVVGP